MPPHLLNFSDCRRLRSIAGNTTPLIDALSTAYVLIACVPFAAGAESKQAAALRRCGRSELCSTLTLRREEAC